METVQSIDRPDVNGVAPKMQAIANSLRASKALASLPLANVKCNDNIMSSVWLFGSLDAPEQWTNGIYENSRYFGFSLLPEKGKRYYTEGEKITVELTRRSHKLAAAPKFRKYTGTPEQCIAKITAWLAAVCA